jgi:asparagine synthase (glutamine-hydrolysing)
LVHLIGDWSAALWKPATRSIILASDYAGVRPLYYHANAERVVWSSYLKAVLSFTGFTDLDDRFIAGFLSGTGSPNRTPYRSIFPVPPGQALHFGGGGIHARKFWNLPVREQLRYVDEREYDQRLRDLFQESVAARLRTVFPVCSELSGGLDSSSIVCMATRLISQRSVSAPSVTSFSFGPPGAPDEKFYTAVKTFCGIESVYVNTDEFPFIRRGYMDDAAPAPWGALIDELARHAQQMGSRVYFTGQGGDLMMGNWVDDSDQLAARLRQGQFRQAFTDAVGWSKATRVPAPALLWRGLRACLPARWPISSRYKTQSGTMVRERHGDSLTPHFKSKTGIGHADGEWPTQWKDALPERRKHFRSVSRILESGFFRPPERLQHLYYTHPYSHRPLVEFLLAIPADQLSRPNEPRRLMRRAFRELLPPEIVTRRSKASFTGEFLKSLRPVARELLTDTRPLLTVEQGYVNRKELRERLERMTQSLSCNESQLRLIVLLELWLRARTSEALPRQTVPLARAASFRSTF